MINTTPTLNLQLIDRMTEATFTRVADWVDVVNANNASAFIIIDIFAMNTTTKIDNLGNTVAAHTTSIGNLSNSISAISTRLDTLEANSVLASGITGTLVQRLINATTPTVGNSNFTTSGQVAVAIQSAVNDAILASWEALY